MRRQGKIIGVHPESRDGAMPKVLAMQVRGSEVDYQHPWERAECGGTSCRQRWVKAWCSLGSQSNLIGDVKILVS